MFNRYINESNEKAIIIRSINNSKTDKKLKDMLINIVNTIVIDNDEVSDVKSIVSGVVKNTFETNFGDTVLNSKGIALYNDFMDFIEDTQTQSVISKVENLVDDYSEYLDSLEEYIKNTSKQKSKTTVQPKSKYELVRIIKDYCEKNGWNSDLNFIDTSLITDMRFLFGILDEEGYGLDRFNGDISKWDVSNVKDMEYMFCNATTFNQPLNNWNVSNVDNMFGMFWNAEKFNQPLNNWDVSNVKSMSYMFQYAEKFNQPLNNWDVSNVVSMYSMFYEAKSFNQPLDNWDVSRVEDMRCMFYEAKSFNQPLDNWDVSNVEYMIGMFDSSKLEKEHNLPDWYR
jgi:surface protein